MNPWPGEIVRQFGDASTVPTPLALGPDNPLLASYLGPIIQLSSLDDIFNCRGVNMWRLQELFGLNGIGSPKNFEASTRAAKGSITILRW